MWTYDELRDGGPTPGQIRASIARGDLTHPYRNLYLAPDSGLIERLRAVRRLVPDHACFSHHTAAHLHGFGAFGSDRIHVIVPAGAPFPDIKGIVTHQAVLLYEPVMVGGVPCVSADRCAIDLARSLRRGDAIALLDAALASRAVDADSLAREVLRHDRLRGVRQARELVPLADPGAECRQESQLRLVILDGRLPRPESQLWVPDDWGDPRYRIDLGWRKRKIGVEYDGQSHLDRARMRHDRTRHNWLETRGWHMRYFTDQDLYQTPESIVAVLRATLASR